MPGEWDRQTGEPERPRSPLHLAAIPITFIPMRTLTLALIFAATALAQPVRELAERRGIRIGAAVNPSRLSEPAYAETLAREFNQAEPENAMKFGPIHPARDQFNWLPADAVVNFAREHQMAVRGHTLVWHQQAPAWATAPDLTPAERAAILREHIAAVVGRYAGKVYAWDVVNEAIEKDGSPRKSPWSPVPDYIESAFRWAHAADPQAKLFYNDYDAESVNPKSDAVYALVKDLKSRGVPIDGVGMQFHLTAKPLPVASIEANMKRLTDLGLEVQITELDVRLPLDAPDLEAQARVYRDLMQTCLKFPKCTAVQTWGFTDKYSWVPGYFKGTGAALPFDRDYHPKPAWQAIHDALAAR